MKDYTKENIKILSDIEHIQLRKGMYIGESLDARQLLGEILDNAIDEVQAGFSEKAVIIVDSTIPRYTVRDFGRGIPHGKKELEDGSKKEVLEVLMTISNSGGKFNNDSYNYSSGLNGLGLTITNALSKELNIKSYRKGKCVEGISFQGKNTEIKKYRTLEKDGTEVSFIPNENFFQNIIIPDDYIIKRCRIASALGFKTELIINNEKINTNATIFDLVKEEDDKIHTYYDFSPFDILASNNERMKVALRYTSDTKDRYFGFTNLLDNYLGGTHINELNKNIINSWETFIDKHRNLKPEIELKKTDYLIGLRAICAVFISKPEFSSQTKEKLVNNKKYFEELMTLFSKQFIKYLNNNLEIAQSLIKRFEEYRISQNNLLSRKEITSLIKINNDTSDNIRRRSIVSKLIECTSKCKKDTELFIVEGDSAAGPYMSARDKIHQAVLPLRGKVLNVTGKTIKECIQNKEICDIANSIGCGIGDACDASKSRYERIIISADADPDGEQINCLILSIFINLFPELVKEGMVYVSMPPLYCWGTSYATYGWCNKAEDIPNGVTNIQRFKGLGEMNVDQLDYFLVNPSSRRLMQIIYPSDIDKFNRILGTSEGKNELLKELNILR